MQVRKWKFDVLATCLDVEGEGATELRNIGVNVIHLDVLDEQSIAKLVGKAKEMDENGIGNIVCNEMVRLSAVYL